MEAFYPYFLILHLFCAIVFLGFIFCDVVFLTPLRGILGDDFADKMFNAISKRSKFMPLVFLLLILSGGAMLSSHINSQIGYFSTHTQQFLVIKTILAFVIFLMIALNLLCFYVLKKKPPFRQIHKVALFLGVIIVILAKFAFY